VLLSSSLRRPMAPLTRMKSDFYWVMDQLELYDLLAAVMSGICFLAAQHFLLLSVFYISMHIRKLMYLLTRQHNTLAVLRWVVKRACYVIASLLGSLLFEHCGEVFFRSRTDFSYLTYPPQSLWKWIFRLFTDPKLMPRVPSANPNFFNLAIPLLRSVRLGMRVQWVLLLFLCVLNYFTGPIPPNEAGPAGTNDHGTAGPQGTGGGGATERSTSGGGISGGATVRSRDGGSGSGTLADGGVFEQPNGGGNGTGGNINGPGDADAARSRQELAELRQIIGRLLYSMAGLIFWVLVTEITLKRNERLPVYSPGRLYAEALRRSSE
jgi:hypothetical protein